MLPCLSVHPLLNASEDFLRIARFLIAGGTATAVNLATLYALVHFAGLWYLLSSVIAFFMGFVVSFTLQKFWTFKDHRTDVVGKQLVVYLGIVLFNLLLNTALVYVLVEYVGFSPIFAQALAALTIAVEGYFAYKIFVFQDSEKNGIEVYSSHGTEEGLENAQN